MYCAKCGEPVKGKGILCRKCAKGAKAAARVQNRSEEKEGRRKSPGIGAGLCAGIAVGFVSALLVCLIAAKRNDSADKEELQEAWRQEDFGERNSEQTVSADGTVSEALSEENAEGVNPERTNREGTNPEGTNTGEGASDQTENIKSREELEQEREARIMALYEQKWLLQEAARGLAADCLEAIPFVTVDPREEFSIADVVLDEVTGNLIISESAKEMYRSFSEGKSLSDICISTAETAWGQIPQYLSDEAESLLQDMVTGLIGVDVFSAFDIVTRWKNADDTPIVLMQKILDAQQGDVYKLTLFLEQEEISAAELYRIAQLMYAMQMREQDMDEAESGYIEIQTDYQGMRELAFQYAVNEAELLFLTQTELPEEAVRLNEAELESSQRQAQEILERYGEMSGLEIGNVSVNYDIEGFQEAQKTVSQNGMLGELFMGDLLGGVYNESGQTVEDMIQEERAGLCDRLTDFIEESYWEVAFAQEDFIMRFSLLEHMASAAGDDRYLAALYFGQTSWKEDMEAAAEAYLTALSRYLFDIDSAYMLYDCILTDAQTDFLIELMLEMDRIRSILQSFEGVEYAGYSDEEAADRWDTLLSCYTQSVDNLEKWGKGLGEIPGFYSNGSLTVYGDANYSAYTKEFTAESKPLVIYGSSYNGHKSAYYYDTEGRLLCAVSGGVRITCRGYSVISYTDGENRQYQWNLGVDSLEQRTVSELTTKAEDMYNRFAN